MALTKWSHWSWYTQHIYNRSPSVSSLSKRYICWLVLWNPYSKRIEIVSAQCQALYVANTKRKQASRVATNADSAHYLIIIIIIIIISEVGHSPRYWQPGQAFPATVLVNHYVASVWVLLHHPGLSRQVVWSCCSYYFFLSFIFLLSSTLSLSEGLNSFFQPVL